MHPLLLFVSLLGLTVPAMALASGGRLPVVAAPSAVPPGPHIYPAANGITPGTPPTRGPSFALRPQLEAVLTIQLLAELTASGELHWTAEQRAQLRSLLRPLEQREVSRSAWSTLGEGWAALLSPDQRRQLERARAAADARAERLLSTSRLALLDGPGTSQAQWRYAFAIRRGAGLVRWLEEQPQGNPYRLAPYREQLATLLGK
ncbi:MAG: hypothetical protein Q4C67_01070 [Deinococcus sp.]|nr:hypothetical protein [Deinococcus sp.]